MGENKILTIFILFTILLFIIIVISIIIIENHAKKNGYKSDSTFKKVKQNKYSKDILNLNRQNIFNDYYQSIIQKYQNRVGTLENQDNILSYQRTKIIGYIIIFIFYALMSFSRHFLSSLFIIFLLLFSSVTITVFIILGFLKRKERDYRTFYKKNIIPPLINSVNNEYTYNHNYYKNHDVEEEILDNYRNSLFDKSIYTKIYADDYISGQLNDCTPFKLSDISLIYEKPAYRRTIKEHVFDGIFSYFDLKQDINCDIRISSKDFDLTKNIIKAYTDNQYIANQLLASDIPSFLIDFYKKYNLDFDICFNHNQVHFRFFTDVMFEPSLLKDSINEDDLFDYYCDLIFIIEMMEKINEYMDNIVVLNVNQQGDAIIETNKKVIVYCIKSSFESPEYKGDTITSEYLNRKLSVLYLLYLFVRFVAVYFYSIHIRNAIETIKNAEESLSYYVKSEAIFLPIMLVFSLCIVYLIAAKYANTSGKIIKLKDDSNKKILFTTPLFIFIIMGLVSTYFIAYNFIMINSSINSNIIVCYIWLREILITVFSIMIHNKIIKDNIQN